MKACVAVLVVLSAVMVESSSSGDIPGCKEDVLDRLYELWQKKGVPCNITEYSLAKKVDFVVATTRGYYYDDGKIHCVSTEWTACEQGATLTSTYIYEDGRNRTATFSVVEWEGTLIQPGTEIVRYYIPTGENVSAFMKCDKYGRRGRAQGLVKVNTNYKKEVLLAAIEDLQYVLGEELTEEFADTCKED